ncbi:cell division protein SepF [Collinsella sp. AGMB00827]|uniref:Cell division protein SepF n=1 Tax=Collinsella ureilytica TaxID=2869515 RepID=A0ABS7MLH2_9ACTN|nr:cell division protein SepF [Collinsella urealyticum]MBY4797916.1 cell division protein SepF [Collinsella urealyticum]
MGFLDEIKGRLPFGLGGNAAYGHEDDDYVDEYYDDPSQDPYGDDAYHMPDSAYPARADDGQRSGVLGQTRRGEAESIAVYTRSGELVGDADRHVSTYAPPARSADAAMRPGAYDTPSSYAESVRYASAAPASSPDPIATRTAQAIHATPQLPAFILRPESYDDVETVVRRVRTKQPVVLVFAGVRTEVAKRVLDFSYGFACGLGATVRELGDRLFIVLPAGSEVRESDLAKLRQEGYLKK